MTKKTIMESLKEADEKENLKGHYYMDQLFSHAADNENDLKFESIEQCVAVRSLDALERIANALEKESDENSGDQTLTYQEFFEEFNKKFDGLYARKSDRGGVDIIITEEPWNGELRASLLPHTNGWYFAESGFSADELMLMAKLAATPPELRGKI